MEKSFLPINNQYSSIDLPTLNKTPILKKKGIERNSLLEIAKYTGQLTKSQDKTSLILESKNPIESNTIPQKKSSYYEKVDMLTYVPQKGKEIEMKTNIQKYLKSFTTLDIELAQNKNTLYEFNSNTLNSKILNKNVYKILEYSFFEMSSVISTPNFYISPKIAVINLFFFVTNSKLAKKNFLELNLNKLQGLSNKLSKYFKKPVHLDLTQIYSVSNNTDILVNVLGKLGLSRRNSFSRIIGRFFKYQSNKIFFRNNQNKLSKFATILTGVNIKLGGRLMKGKIVPRRSVKKIQYGSLARSKANYITTARLTQKNKRGSFSFTVSIGHKFF
uniref:Small ribosomal subunit protein uS3m n=1 Tax=Trametes hirsuta TaxID=5327 RepID=A0A2L2FQK2_TRAHI|nr:ribosomal protein S3 [Trametes hirsuta]AVG72792.1 ribosomal protein S3 [Trametes hirsuta]WVH38255.1 ribosomal protein S3 [Trametes maxima]